jgi:hypothetical protein
LCKFFIILITFLFDIGCSNGLRLNNESVNPDVVRSLETIKPSTEANIDVQTPTPNHSASPTLTPKNLDDYKIITGTYIYSWPNPLNLGTVEVTNLGVIKYHIHVSVVHGFSHHMVEIDSDFTYDGKKVFSNDEYKEERAMKEVGKSLSECKMG